MTTDTTTAAIEALMIGAEWQEPESLRRYLFPTFSALAAERDAALTEAAALRKEVARLRNIVTEQGQTMAQRLSRAEASELREAALRGEVARLKDVIGYVLQDDLLNRLTPRVVDIAYSAFRLGRSGKNKDDGGPCDWFNDTKPMVMVTISQISAALTSKGGEG